MGGKEEDECGRAKRAQWAVTPLPPLKTVPKADSVHLATVRSQKHQSDPTPMASMPF